MPIVTFDQLKSHKIDYVIVGGGTSGLALAARLTEDPNTVVLVVEAGGSHGEVPEIDVPGYIGKTIWDPKYDWKFVSVPQKRANDRVVIQPRGKGLGGSSFMNYLIMLRPSKSEMDALEELGNPGWNWETMLHYMKKGETLQNSNLPDEQAIRYAAKPDPSLHGTDGPIKKSFPTVLSDLHGKLFDAAESLGIWRNVESGNGRNDGATTSLLTEDVTTTTRSYSVTAYLNPNLGRSNFLVLTHAQVIKVLLTPEGDLNRATGVELYLDGILRRIEQVRRDVIISCGTLQTPHLLELSGIGNADILSKHGIPVVVNLPGVGENLQDHAGIPTIFEAETPEDTMESLANPELRHKHEELYKQHQGLLSTVPVPAFVFLTTDTIGSKEEIDFWKAQAHVQCTEVLAKVEPSLRSGLEKQYAVQRRLFTDSTQTQAEIIQFNGHQPNALSKPEPGKKYSTLICMLTHPLSRGTVHLASADPLAPPAIDPNYFANDADMDLVVHIIEKAIQLFKTPPLAAHIKGPKMPPQELLDRGREGLREFIKDNVRPVYHPVGTAAMMPRADGGVVDASLKVYGTTNLRVVDLSIFPMELSCHTQSVAYAVAEKAADIIRGQAV